MSASGGFLQQCAGAILLVDAAEMDDCSPEQDYFAMKLLSYLNELRRRWRAGVARPAGGGRAQQGRSMRKLLRRSGRFCPQAGGRIVAALRRAISPTPILRLRRGRSLCDGRRSRRRPNCRSASNRTARNRRAVRMVGEAVECLRLEASDGDLCHWPPARQLTSASACQRIDHNLTACH